MPTVVLDLPGLSHRLLDRLPVDRRPPWLRDLIARGTNTLQPVTPAVTMPAQATLTTGLLPQQHGIVANGIASYRDPSLHTHLDLTNHAEDRQRVSFWEQSNDLLNAPRVWQGDDRNVAMLFFQSSIQSANIVVTPKPAHTADGKTVSHCWTHPTQLNTDLVEQLGPFPLHHYWGPVANIESSKWIVACAQHVWSEHTPDLMLTYIPHLDYNLQRLGPSSDAIVEDLAAVFECITPLAERAIEDGAQLLLLSEYGMTDASQSIAPNTVLRANDLLNINDEGLIDFANTPAFAMCDHQIAHVYVKQSSDIERIAQRLIDLPEVTAHYVGPDREKIGLNTERAGDIVLLTREDAWFEYRWWDDWSQAPDFAWTVDIHRKPGYDPTELFFDPANKRIRADQPQLVKGSHGSMPRDTADWPVLIGHAAQPDPIPMTEIAGLL